MKPIKTLFAMCCMAVLAVTVYAQATENQMRQPLSYVQSSSGLANPEWEGGRTELEFADINQDGFLDIITIGDHSSPYINGGLHGIIVYFGDGQGNWTVQMTGDFGYGGIAAGDVNNDGHMDVGYGMHHDYSSTDLGDQLIEVALGDGTGVNWTPWDDGLATNGEDWGMFSTDFADVDNDGDLDLGSISFGCCSGVHIYLNNMDGTWTQSFGFNSGNSDMIFEFGDINNDGNMDFIVGHEDGTAYFGDGTGAFTLNDTGLPPAGSLGRFGPALGDVNNDGYLDMAFTASGGGLYVYTWDNGLQQWTGASGTLPASGTWEMTELEDMDMDGFVDLAAFGRGTFKVFLGDGKGNWTESAGFTIGSPGYAQAFRVGGDVDHNGLPDVVLLEETGSWFNYQNHLWCYREASVPYGYSISPVFPRGKELLRPGSVRFIDWMSAVPGGKASQVRLEYSVTGNAGPWTLIADNLPDNGRFQWIVPQENSPDCYIRYTVTSGIAVETGMTPSAFTITDGTIGVKEWVALKHEIVACPNPAKDWLTVSNKHHAAGRKQKAGLLIADYSGRALLDYPAIDLPFRVDVSGIPDGIYFLQVTGTDGWSSSTKFVKLTP